MDNEAFSKFQRFLSSVHLPFNNVCIIEQQKSNYYYCKALYLHSKLYFRTVGARKKFIDNYNATIKQVTEYYHSLNLSFTLTFPKIVISEDILGYYVQLKRIFDYVRFIEDVFEYYYHYEDKILFITSDNFTVKGQFTVTDYKSDKRIKSLYIRFNGTNERISKEYSKEILPLINIVSAFIADTVYKSERYIMDLDQKPKQLLSLQDLKTVLNRDIIKEVKRYVTLKRITCGSNQIY